ncbi:MAG: hypothetical protein HUU46_00525 [Candidatus Hydrogenedentes bacterium]|nr:hypothetical protein [Candidatus Hydrogenedentota bacterium]
MKHLAFAVAIAMCLTGCHTFMRVAPDYADLPVDDVKAVAAEIEQAIHNKERQPDIKNRGAVVVETDAIKQAIRTRAARAHLIEAFLETGHLMEANNGLVSILRTREYKHFGSSRDRDRNAQLVLGENADRWALYEGILKASNFSPKSLPAVQRIFFEAHLAVLPDGSKFEDESGNVAYKGGSPAAKTN